MNLYFDFKFVLNKVKIFTLLHYINTVENIVQSADDLRYFPTNSVVFLGKLDFNCVLGFRMILKGLFLFFSPQWLNEYAEYAE